MIFKMKPLLIVLPLFLIFPAFGDKKKEIIPQRIIEAIQKGDLKKVKAYVHSGNRLNAIENYYGRDLLQFASIELQPKIVKFLTENGFDVNTPTAIRDYPIHLALEGGQYYTGNNIDTRRENPFGSSGDFYQTLEVLTEAKADLNVRNRNGLTPLLMVIPDTKLMKFFLDKGADLEFPNFLGRTALI